MTDYNKVKKIDNSWYEIDEEGETHKLVREQDKKSLSLKQIMLLAALIAISAILGLMLVSNTNPNTKNIVASDRQNPRVGTFYGCMASYPSNPYAVHQYGAQYYKIDEVWAFMSNCLQNSNLIFYNSVAHINFTTVGGLVLFRQCINADALPGEYFRDQKEIEKTLTCLIESGVSINYTNPSNTSR